MLAQDTIIKNGMVRTNDSIMECPYCKSTFQKDHVRTRMRKWGKDSFYSTRHCPNCDKRITLRDDNPDIESINTRLSKLRTYCNYCKMNGQFDDYRDAMGETLELQKQIEDMRNGEMKSKVKDATNYNGERTFQTYEAWKRACRQIDPNVKFDGDKDICQAGKVGEWDGDKGIIYNTKDRKTKDEEFLGKDQYKIKVYQSGGGYNWEVFDPEGRKSASGLQSASIENAKRDADRKLGMQIFSTLDSNKSMKDAMIRYKGFSIVEDMNGHFMVLKDVGKYYTIEQSLEAAKDWIDDYLKQTGQSNDSKQLMKDAASVALKKLGRVKKQVGDRKTKDALFNEEEVRARGKKAVVKEKLITFFKANPNPDDDKVHAFAEQNGIDPHELEEEIYKIVTEHVGMVKDDDYKRMSLAELQKKAKEGYFELQSDPKPRNHVEVKYPDGKKEWVFVEDSKPTAKDGMGDYEVVYSDRNYNTVRKVFKNDPQGTPENAAKAARNYARKLEEKDAKDPYGNIRGEVIVRATRDSKPTAKDKLLKGLDSLKRRMKDAFGMNIEEQQKQFDTRNIEKETIENNAFRKVIFTGNTLQLVLMSLLPNEDIGMEVHDKVDQFFRVEEGEGLLEVEGQGTQPLQSGSSILITAGTKHNVKNIGDKPLKLYTIYGPPNHPADTLQNTKAEAVAAEKTAVGDRKTKDASPADSIKNLLQKGYSLKEAILETEKSIGRQLNAFEAAEAVAVSKKMGKTKDVNPPSESERIKNDFESGRKDHNAGYYDKWYRWNRKDNGRAYDDGFNSVAGKPVQIIEAMHDSKTKDKVINYRGQMIDVGAGSMGDWSSICSIPKNPTNPIMAWGKTEQEAIENIKPKIDKVLSSQTKDAAKLALDSLAKLRK